MVPGDPCRVGMIAPLEGRKDENIVSKQSRETRCNSARQQYSRPRAKGMSHGGHSQVMP